MGLSESLTFRWDTEDKNEIFKRDQRSHDRCSAAKGEGDFQKEQG